MKTFLKLLLLVGAIVYLIFAFTHISGGSDTTRCTEVNIVISDSDHAGFITAEEVKRILCQKKIYPEGSVMDSINGDSIERTLLKNSFIKLAKCYKTAGGKVNIHVAQSLPVIRIKADNGDDYYLGTKGEIMQPQNYAADIAIATGNISRKYAQKELLPMAKYLHTHEFANDLVAQIYVDDKHHINLVPRIGCEIVRLGRPDSTQISTLFRNLQAFYTKVLPSVGWNTYHEISLEYSGQIIARKG